MIIDVAAHLELDDSLGLIVIVIGTRLVETRFLRWSLSHWHAGMKPVRGKLKLDHTGEERVLRGGEGDGGNERAADGLDIAVCLLRSQISDRKLDKCAFRPLAAPASPRCRNWV